MTVPALPGLSHLAGRYDALLCDVWGVIHNGRTAHHAAVDALQHFREKAGIVVLITNSPRPSAAIRVDLKHLNVPEDAFDAMVSSGDVTRGLIRKYAGRPVHWVGPARDRTLFEGLDVQFAGADQAAVVVVTDLDQDQETPADYDGRMRSWLDRSLPVICANPDIVVEQGDKLVYCGGALAQAYSDLGGEVQIAGKPSPPAYQAAMELIGSASGRKVEKSDVLAIGDSVRTDAEGAARFGLDFVFIAGALHAADLAGTGRPDPAAVGDLLAATGVRAVGFMPELRW